MIAITDGISPLLTQSQLWLQTVEEGLSPVNLVGQAIDIPRPSLLHPAFRMTYWDMLRAIPSAEEVQVKKEEIEKWVAHWDRSATVLHLLGQRFLEEGFYELSMAALLRAIVIFYSFEGDDVEMKAGFVQADIHRVPPAHETRSPLRDPGKTLEAWSLREALARHQTSLDQQTIHHVPLPVLDEAQVRTGEMRRSLFDLEWEVMPKELRKALEATMVRVYKFYNPSALTLLNSIVYTARIRLMSQTQLHQYLARAIEAFDIVFRENHNDGIFIFKIEIDHFPFSNMGVVKPELLGEWEGQRPLPKGVRIFLGA